MAAGDPKGECLTARRFEPLLDVMGGSLECALEHPGPIDHDLQRRCLTVDVEGVGVDASEDGHGVVTFGQRLTPQAKGAINEL